MRSVLPILVSSAVVAFGSASAPGAVGPRVAVQPSIVRLVHQAGITVSGLSGDSVQANVVGGTYPDGTLDRKSVV